MYPVYTNAGVYNKEDGLRGMACVPVNDRQDDITYDPVVESFYPLMSVIDGTNKGGNDGYPFPGAHKSNILAK